MTETGTGQCRAAGPRRYRKETTMQITGEMLIGARSVRGKAGTFHAFDPVQGRYMEPAFGVGDEIDVERACRLAAQAFDPYRALPLERRARFLEAIAQNILDLGDALIERARAETGLPDARLRGERMRTVNQLRLFAEVARTGNFLSASIDSTRPERTDIRLRKIPLGPVAVFGASNFPLAFSVAGGDTASALAAGCPVIVKAHPAHPGTSELAGRAIQKAVRDCGLHEGVFSLLVGDGHAVGEVLVGNPHIQAVGFTGSRQGGLALLAIANARPQPIPVYAEMSAVNPIFLLPGALRKRASDLATGFVDSLTLGAGQFCTNPGVVVAIESPALDAFRQAAKQALACKSAATLLTPGILKTYERGVRELAMQPPVRCLGCGQAPAADSQGCAQACVFMTGASDFLQNKVLQEEVFGPASLLVACRDEIEMLTIAESMEGQLTATLQLEEEDKALATRLLPKLECLAGRILVNGFPTGVEVCHAMVHGGPFPSTSNSMYTSVGATAIDRFLRPMCYQNLPEWLGSED
jgi:NADP-dependent aldehyde dehydrogenase